MTANYNQEPRMLRLPRSQSEYLAHVARHVGQYGARSEHAELRAKLARLDLSVVRQLVAPFLYSRLWPSRHTAREHVAVVGGDGLGRRNTNRELGEPDPRRALLR